MKKSKNKQTETDNSREAVFTALQSRYKDILDSYSVKPVSQEDILPTPSMSLNLLCGKDKGIRKGSIVHWWGLKGSLKSTFAWQMIAQSQAKWPDKINAYIDTELGSDLHHVTKDIGVNLDPFETGVPRVIYRRPSCAEEAWEMIGALAATGHMGVIVLDSGTAMRSKSVVDNPDFTLGQVGTAARINSAALQKYAPMIIETGTILWGINQIRVTGIQPVVQKGPTGGEAWGFYCSHEVKVTRLSHDKPTELNQTLSLNTKKMRYAWGDREVEVPVILGKGVNIEADIIDAAVEAGIIQKSGSWYNYGETRLGQGLPNAGQFLREHPDTLEEISEAILSMATE